MTCFSLSFYRKPSFGFGIQYFVLTLCGCGLTILIHFNILLGFLNFLGIILILSLSYYPIRYYKRIWCFILGISLVTLINILIRIILFFSSFEFDLSYFTVNSTSGQNPMDISSILNDSGGNNSTPGNNNPTPGGSNSPSSGRNPYVTMPGIIAKLELQLAEPVYGWERPAIYSSRFNSDARLTPAECEFLGDTISNDRFSRPYYVITRHVDNNSVQRVVQIPLNSTRMPNAYSPDVKASRTFINFLRRY